MRHCLLALALTFSTALFAQSVRQAPAVAPSTGRVAPQGEPGQALTVSGVVVDAAGTKVFLRSGAKGEWSFQTIKPGSYPGSRIPAHIHFEVSAKGHAPRIFEIVFEGDPFLTDQMRSDAAFSVRRIEDGRVRERIVMKFGRCQRSRNDDGYPLRRCHVPSPAAT